MSSFWQSTALWSTLSPTLISCNDATENTHTHESVQLAEHRGAQGQAQLHHRPACMHGTVEGLESVLIYKVDVGASVDEQLERREVALHDATVEGRLVIDVPRVEIRSSRQHHVQRLQQWYDD
jgi:hypothetical protein